VVSVPIRLQLTALKGHIVVANIEIISIRTKKTDVFLAKKGLKIKGSRVQEVQEFKMADIRCALKLMIGCYFKYLVVSVFLLTFVLKRN